MSPKEDVNELIAAAHHDSMVRYHLTKGRASFALYVARQRYSGTYRLNVDESDLQGLRGVRAENLTTFQRVCHQIGLAGEDNK